MWAQIQVDTGRVKARASLRSGPGDGQRAC